MKVANKITTIICDDARQEITGKISLIGVYAADVILSNFPGLVPIFTFVVILAGIKKVFNEVKVIFTYEGIEKPIEIKLPAQVHKGSDNNFLFAITPLKVEKPGEAKFSVYVDTEEKPIAEHKFSFLLNK